MRPFEYAELLQDHALFRDALINAPESLFVGLTPAEILAHKSELVGELILDASFKLLTRIEADIRSDFIETIVKNWMDSLSRKYVRVLGRTKNPNHVGAGPILEAICRHFRAVGDPFEAECVELREYFRFRHWYAHGRFLVIMPTVPFPSRLEQLGRKIFATVIARTH